MDFGDDADWNAAGLFRWRKMGSGFAAREYDIHKEETVYCFFDDVEAFKAFARDQARQLGDSICRWADRNA